VKISSSVRRATIEWVAIVFALVGLRCGAAPPSGAEPVVATPAPPNSTPVTFAFDSLDERSVTSAAMRGKPTVITFVTTDSLAAQAQVDFLVVMAKKDAGAVNYVIVAIGSQDTRELVELYRQALHVSFFVAMADGATLAGGGAFGDVRGVPVTVILNREGRPIWRADGRVAQSAELRAVFAKLERLGRAQLDSPPIL
jgi:hypothetical protein